MPDPRFQPIEMVALHVSLPVLDLARAEGFYIALLAPTVTAREEGLTNLRVGGHRLSLRSVAPDSESLQRGGDRGLRARHWGFAVGSPREVDAAAAVVERLGGTTVVEPTDRSDGRTYVFCDESGNQVEIYYERM